MLPPAAFSAPELDFMQPARFSPNAGFEMRFPCYICFAIILFAFFCLPLSPAFAQREDMSIGDQPGVIPTPADEELPLQFRRQVVLYRSSEAPGTIIVHTAERFLYVVQPNGRALRYGIGVGREGFQWQGLLRITRKQEWPDWTPPSEMIERQPYLPRFMAGGPGNPMGARALYLGETVYRIHGTNQPKTIGSAVSSGCFRLVNGDVVDLYDRIPVGTKVIVRQKPDLWSRHATFSSEIGHAEALCAELSIRPLHWFCDCDRSCRCRHRLRAIRYANTEKNAA